MYNTYDMYVEPWKYTIVESELYRYNFEWVPRYAPK